MEGGKGFPRLKGFHGFLVALFEVADGAIRQLSGKGLRVHAADGLRGIADGMEREEGQAEDPYAVLGVCFADDRATIRKVYLRLQKLYHEAGACPNQAKLKQINAAYENICHEKGWVK